MVKGGIELDSQAIRDFCHRWKITELCVFGSILRSDFGPNSDIDLLADYRDDAEWDLFDLGDMRKELSTILGRPVDLLTRPGLQSSENRSLKREIFSTLERVYAA